MSWTDAGEWVDGPWPPLQTLMPTACPECSPATFDHRTMTEKLCGNHAPTWRGSEDGKAR
jgi:hypothetical protein